MLPPLGRAMLPAPLALGAPRRIPTQKYERALGVIGTDVTFICGGDLSSKGS